MNGVKNNLDTNNNVSSSNLTHRRRTTYSEHGVNNKIDDDTVKNSSGNTSNVSTFSLTPEEAADMVDILAELKYNKNKLKLAYFLVKNRNYISVTEAAKLLKVKRQAIHQMLENSEIFNYAVIKTKFSEGYKSKKITLSAFCEKYAAVIEKLATKKLSLEEILKIEKFKPAIQMKAEKYFQNNGKEFVKRGIEIYINEGERGLNKYLQGLSTKPFWTQEKVTVLKEIIMEKIRKKMNSTYFLIKMKIYEKLEGEE